MNFFVSKTEGKAPPKNTTGKTLAQIKAELTSISKSEQLRVKGGRILRINTDRKYCRNCTPQ